LSRYKIGVIDFLTLYDNTKMVENKLKATIHGVNEMDVSAIDPERY
jgi:hypothetical protein